MLLRDTGIGGRLAPLGGQRPAQDAVGPAELRSSQLEPRRARSLEGQSGQDAVNVWNATTGQLVLWWYELYFIDLLIGESL